MYEIKVFDTVSNKIRFTVTDVADYELALCIKGIIDTYSNICLVVKYVR